MRIGLVCPYSLDVAGGVQQQVLELAASLRERGHDARVLAPGTRHPLQPAHVTTTGAAVPVRWNGAVARVHVGPDVGRETRRWLSEGRFDLLHVHEPVTPSVSWHAVRAAKVPVVGTVHTAQDSARVLRLGASTALRGVRERVDVWTAVSPDAARTSRSYLDTDPVLVPNALHVDAYVHRGAATARTAGARPPGDRQVQLVFLGRLEEPRKGLAVALAAFAAVADRRPEVVLDVAGPGDLDRVVRALRPALPAAARRRVRSLGALDHAAKTALLAQADVVLAPQLGGESFGIVVAEAMAAGASVVASDLPAFRRLLEGGRCGVLVPPGDVAAWSAAVEAVVTDPARRAELGRRAQAGVQHLDWGRVTPSLLDVYARALAAPA